MEKVLVYGKTIREARHYYQAKPGQIVGHRTYDEYDNGESYDERIVVNPKLIEKSKKGAKE